MPKEATAQTGGTRTEFVPAAGIEIGLDLHIATIRLCTGAYQLEIANLLAIASGGRVSGPMSRLSY